MKAATLHHRQRRFPEIPAPIQARCHRFAVFPEKERQLILLILTQLRGYSRLSTSLNFFGFDHVDRTTAPADLLNHAIALFRDSHTVSPIGLFDGNLPIPVLNGPGEIELLPFLRHLHLSLRPREFSLLKLGVLFVDHEASQEIKLSAD